MRIEAYKKANFCDCWTKRRAVSLRQPIMLWCTRPRCGSIQDLRLRDTNESIKNNAGATFVQPHDVTEPSSLNIIINIVKIWYKNLQTNIQELIYYRSCRSEFGSRLPFWLYTESHALPLQCILGPLTGVPDMHDRRARSSGTRHLVAPLRLSTVASRQFPGCRPKNLHGTTYRPILFRVYILSPSTP